MRHVFWYSKGLGTIGVFSILYGLVRDVNHSKRIDKKIVEMRKQGKGIWVNGKFIPMG